jgi:hypothetical protein
MSIKVNVFLELVGLVTYKKPKQLDRDYNTTVTCHWTTVIISMGLQLLQLWEMDRNKNQDYVHVHNVPLLDKIFF